MAYDPITNPIDYVIVAGTRSPGIARVDGNRSHQWDERRGHGMSGASSVYKGAKLAHFTVEIDVWTSEQFVELNEFRSIVSRLPTPTDPRGFVVEHPFLEELGITKCALEDLGVPKQNDEGLWTLTIKFVEHREPVRRLARSSGEEDGSTNVVNPQDAEITAMTAQVQILSRVDSSL